MKHTAHLVKTSIITSSLLLALGSATAMAVGTGPEASPEVYKILDENDQWRVIEATWQPGQEDNFHSHPGDRVSVYKTDCKLRLTRPDGSYKDVNPRAGQAKARTGKAVKSHKAKNIGDKVCVITIVELK